MTAARSIIPSPAHKAGDQLHGFVIESVTPIPDIKALAYRARHSKTGAEVLAVHANDEENLFSVGFRTPPPDSTGVAHILEHCVLAGSKQFPVKDAFNELGKRTLSTFLNAMTWPDRTIYPTCSAVRADYFNLAKVYSDLVFNPLISQQTFQQEGHHFELEDLEDKASALKVTGVVYNEMKGAYSSPEQVVYRGMQQALLPDTPYGVDSGGDPEVIPDLTYENFVAFHRRFYSPSNARFMLYGDVPLAENLAFLEGVLRPFDKVEVKSELPLQPRWSEPRKSSLEYPVGSDDDLKGKTFITVTWLANETANAMESLLLEIALGALSGTAAGPMRKALIDSGLGKDIFPGGAYEADLRQAFIAFGLRGTDADKADAIEKLILDTLNQVVEAGLDKGLIEASFHQIELGGKEIVPPFPIMLLIRANPTWYFGGDPQDGLRFSTLVEQARKKWEAEPGLFEGLIRKWLIDNPHRLRLVCTPSNTLSAKKDEEFAARMKAEKSAMKPEQVDAIVSTAKALQQMQETPDSPEAINSLPKLAVTDIPKSPREVPEKRADIGATPVFTHEVFSRSSNSRQSLRSFKSSVSFMDNTPS
ncbi:MAG: insulinase family protein, partial [Planctomycetota bacterium]